MASVSHQTFRSWLTETQKIQASEAQSAALFDGYCRMRSAAERGIFWFISSNVPMKQASLQREIVAIYEWAANSKSKQAKRLLSLDRVDFTAVDSQSIS